MAHIKAEPTKGLSYDPGEDRYWDESALEGELERVFDICHGCRLCFNLCPSFPDLFAAVDRNDGDVRKLNAADKEKVVDDCYQCKLCYIKCPYTPDDEHAFQLDFPRLMLRYTAQRAKRRGVGVRQKVLGNPMAVGRLAAPAAGLANTANKVRFHRAVMEKMLGIHRDKQLPEFYRETFEKWIARRRVPDFAVRDEVVLFHTCFVNFNNPQLGRDTVEVLERNRVRVYSPKQTCCGMPALDGGDIDFARKQVRQNIEALRGEVARGRAVLAINPTCSYMLKKEYVELADRHLREDARRLAEATMDPSEYLFMRKRQGDFDLGFLSTPGEVAYHVPCHLRAQNIGFRSRDMMKTIPGAKIRIVEGCCGHDGTWAMKKEHFAQSMRIGEAVFEQMRCPQSTVAAGARVGESESAAHGREACQTATDCPLAAIHIEQGTGRRPLHPLQILARAYRADGFDTAVPETGKAEGGE